MTNETELDLFIERAKETGAYPVLKWYRESWLPYKQTRLRQAITKTDEDNGVENDSESM